MSRFLSNLFIIIVLCMSLSVIPINSNILNLDIKINTPKLPKMTEPAKKKSEALFAILSSTPANTQMTNPSHLVFEVSSPDLKGALDSLKKNVTLEILRDGQNVKSLPLGKLKLTLETSKTDLTRGKVLVPVSFKDLSLLSGKYTLKIQSGNENCANIDGNQYPVFYLDNKTYVKALNPGKYRLMSLFVADSADDLLIPVSRFTYTTKPSTRLLLSELAKGPKIESGLHFVPSALYEAKVTQRRGKVTVDISTDQLNQAQLESANLPLTLQAILSSEFALDYVQSVTLTVDGDPTGTLPPVLGQTAGLEIPKPTTSKVYMGYINNSSYLYLVPLDAGSADVPALFARLKAPASKPVKSGAFVQPIPSEVDLISHKIENGVLTLDLSPEVLKVFAGNENYINLMLDALGNTMTTVPGVESVVLTAGGVPITKIGNTEVPSRIVHKQFLNPEKYEAPAPGASSPVGTATTATLPTASTH